MSDNAPVPIGSTMLPSVLRTLVPMIYAFLVHHGVVAWLGFDDAMANDAITLVVTVLFYVALRFAERYKSQIGWLLGYAKQPVYVQGEVLSVTEDATPPTVTTTVESDAGNSEPGDATPPLE